MVGFFLATSGIGLDYPVTNISELLDSARAPVHSFTLSHPLRHLSRSRLPIRNLSFSFFEPDQVRLAGRLGFPRVHWVPPGSFDVEPVPWPHRHVPVLMPASVHHSPEALRAGWQGKGRDWERALNDIIDAHVAAPDAPLEHAVFRIAEGTSLDMVSLFGDAYDYLRLSCRIEFLRQLEGVPVTVIGRGWDRYRDAIPHATFLGEVSFERMFELLRHSMNGKKTMRIDRCLTFSNFLGS